MSQVLAKQSLPIIDNLAHAIAGLRHVEQPYLEARLKLRKNLSIQVVFEKELEEVEAKLNMWESEKLALESWTLQWLIHYMTCGLQQEKSRCETGIKKTKQLIAEARAKVDNEAEKNAEIEKMNEKNAVDHRLLEKYREDLTEILDRILENTDHPTDQQGRSQIETIKAGLQKLASDDAKIAPVKELLMQADLAILETIVDMRQTNKEKSLAKGRIPFPDAAYQAIKKAREIYPELPGIQPPTEYTDAPDETGAYYSPMQRYLWDVRSSLQELIQWCDAKVIEHMEVEALETIALGAKIDEWNMERRRLVQQMLVNDA